MQVKVIAEGGWKSEEYYLWDNWIADSRKYDNKLHRYSLAAPIKDKLTNQMYGPNDRHTLASIRHAYSADNGKTWVETGESFSKEQIEAVGKMLWSGFCTVKEDTENNSYFFIMLVTISRKDPQNGKYIQKIGVSFSRDGEKWEPIEICLEYENVHNYDMSDEDGEGYCWRDPFLFYDKNDDLWHLFWAAKKRLNNSNKLIGVIGHAICLNTKTFKEWKLLPPIDLPHNYGQAELPGVYYYKNHYYMFVCCQTTFNTYASSYHIFVSKYIDRDYELIYSSCRNNEDKKNHFINRNIYAITVFETFDGQIKAVGYFDQFIIKDLMLSTSPIIDIEWNDNFCPSKPQIKYNQAVHLIIAGHSLINA